MSHTQLTHGPRGSFRGHAGRVATSALRETIHQQTVQRYWFSELPTWEKTLLAFDPTSLMVPTTSTRITANITAYSAISWPSSERRSSSKSRMGEYLARES